MSAGLQGAVETAPVTSAHEHRSYDPADFAVPGGREEEWRFTPLGRLRGLHTDEPPAPSAKVTVEIDPAPEVKISTAERGGSLPAPSFIPADRVSARAYASFAEATVSKVSDDQLFYLMSRGMTEFEAMAMIVRGFVEPIAKELPMEYALELNRLIELQMEGAVG